MFVDVVFRHFPHMGLGYTTLFRSITVFHVTLSYIFPGWKFFVGSELGKMPDTTPCLWFWGFQIFYWVRFFPGMKFISFAVVINFHVVIVCWCDFQAFPTYGIRVIQSFVRLYSLECLSKSKFDGTQWGVTECESFHHFTITLFHHCTITPF